MDFVLLIPRLPLSVHPALQRSRSSGSSPAHSWSFLLTFSLLGLHFLLVSPPLQGLFVVCLLGGFILTSQTSCCRGTSGLSPGTSSLYPNLLLGFFPIHSQVFKYHLNTVTVLRIVFPCCTSFISLFI